MLPELRHCLPHLPPLPVRGAAPDAPEVVARRRGTSGSPSGRTSPAQAQDGLGWLLSGVDDELTVPSASLTRCAVRHPPGAAGRRLALAAVLLLAGTKSVTLMSNTPREGSVKENSPRAPR